MNIAIRNLHVVFLVPFLLLLQSCSVMSDGVQDGWSYRGDSTSAIKEYRVDSKMRPGGYVIDPAFISLKDSFPVTHFSNGNSAWGLGMAGGYDLSVVQAFKQWRATSLGSSFLGDSIRAVTANYVLGVKNADRTGLTHYSWQIDLFHVQSGDVQLQDSQTVTMFSSVDLYSLREDSLLVRWWGTQSTLNGDMWLNRGTIGKDSLPPLLINGDDYSRVRRDLKYYDVAADTPWFFGTSYSQLLYTRFIGNQFVKDSINLYTLANPTRSLASADSVEGPFYFGVTASTFTQAQIDSGLGSASAPRICWHEVSGFQCAAIPATPCASERQCLLIGESVPLGIMGSRLKRYAVYAFLSWADGGTNDRIVAVPFQSP